MPNSSKQDLLIKEAENLWNSLWDKFLSETYKFSSGKYYTNEEFGRLARIIALRIRARKRVLRRKFASVEMVRLNTK